ncbi:MAG: hypothetical protein KGR18_08525 [Acidobacteria bacterium]|nr:hypothetical protein [Acidobacteriota bacterium]
MADQPDRGARRRLIIVAAVGLLIVGVVVVGTVIALSREPVRSVAGTCAALEQAKDLDRALASLDPATLSERLGALQRAARAAPGDIAPQISEIATSVANLVDDVDRAGGTDRRAALADALERRADEIDSLSAAGAQLQTWAATNCQIDLGGRSPSPGGDRGCSGDQCVPSSDRSGTTPP